MDAEVFLARACELLAIPSTSERPGELRRALDYVLNFVGPGFTVERFESGGKPSALVYPGTERRDFDVILNAHLDVVPAPPAQFRPRRDEDRLYARGAQDMKVSGLLAAQVFRELAAGLRYPVALQLVTDEEVSGRDGTLHQLERGVRGRFVIVGESSGLRIVNELDPPHHADHDRPEILRLQHAARHQGYSGDMLRKHGVSDGRFYGQLGIAAVAFGVDGSGQHGPDEYADLTTVVPYYHALREFLGAP